jgi:putative phosphoesterase
MKIALISDIHSNLFYLRRVLEEIEKEKVDDIYCLGDLVGYYDEPDEVIKLIKSRGIKCVKGNHDKYLLGELSYDINREKIYRIKQQRESLSSESLEFLRDLKDEIILEVNSRKIYMTHSLPNDCETYIYDLRSLDLNLLRGGINYYFFGHTHIPMVTYHYGICFLNPGSVGQPRDFTKCSSYAIVDFEKEEIKIKRVKQDVETYIQKIKGYYNEQLIEILIRGGF